MKLPPINRRPYSVANNWNHLTPLFVQLFKESVSWIRQPRTIRIGRTKIIITLLWATVLWPTPSTPGHVYADDMGMSAVKPVLEHIPVVSPVEPLERLKPVVVVKKTASAPKRATGGSCASWMAAAGIPSTYATNKLIINESGCRPNAINPDSGACGIPQALPCSKLPCTLQDPVCQLRWMDRYVKEVYGSWENALAKWNSRYPHWY